MANGLDSSSEQVTISENMTKDEVLHSISIEFGIFKEQAEQDIFKSNARVKRQATDKSFVLVRVAGKTAKLIIVLEAEPHIFIVKQLKVVVLELLKKLFTPTLIIISMVFQEQDSMDFPILIVFTTH